MPASAATWKKVSPTEALNWDSVLWHRNAHLFQLAYWNEPFRDFYGRPLYFQLWDSGRIDATAAVMTFGIPGFRVGLLQRGPVLIDKGAGDISLIRSLAETLRSHGIFCLRVTSQDASLLGRLEHTFPSERADAFPFISALQHEGMICLIGDEEKILSRFHPRVRRHILKCDRSDFFCERYSEAEGLKRYWHLFEASARARGFIRRPFSSFHRLFELGRRSPGRVELSVLKAGDCSIGAIIVARDGTTTYYIAGGRDEALSKKFPDTGHYRLWLAMRHAREAGSLRFNLGSVQGSIGQFKLRFAPDVLVNPTPVTLILDPLRYRIWKTATARHGPTRRLVDAIKWLAAARG